MAKKTKDAEPEVKAPAEDAVVVAEPEAEAKPEPKKPAAKKPWQPKLVRLISVFPKFTLIIEPPYTEETSNGNKSRRKTYPGDAIQFRNSFADVNQERADRAMELPNAGIDYMLYDELIRMQDSEDADEKFRAKKFLQQADLKRTTCRLPKLTKEVISV